MNEHYKFQNPPLPYDYAALEPYIDEKTMILHHDRHLQAYVNNLNAALSPYPCLQTWPLESLICNACGLPEAVRTDIEHNAGGVYNHIFYFDGMINGAQKQPFGRLMTMIDKCFGSFDGFKTKFKAEAAGVFGSGYAWLTVNRLMQLQIITTKNQMTPLTLNLYPLLCVDVWEHAYYLKHYNLRADYLDCWFNVVNWAKADQRLGGCFC